MIIDIPIAVTSHSNELAERSKLYNSNLEGRIVTVMLRRQQFGGGTAAIRDRRSIFASSENGSHICSRRTTGRQHQTSCMFAVSLEISFQSHRDGRDSRTAPGALISAGGQRSALLVATRSPTVTGAGRL